MQNAVIYARYSSDKQRDASIEDQIRECTEYAQANSLTVIKTYADRALSGTTDESAQFQLMIKDAAKKQFTQVLIYKTDRFARNRFDAAIYKKKLKDYGVKVVPVKEPIPDGPGGVVMEALYESMAQMYSENLSENVRRGNYPKAKPEKYLLSQKAFCGYCGKMLVGNSGCGHQGNKYRYYRCKGKGLNHSPAIRAETLEETFSLQKRLHELEGQEKKLLGMIATEQLKAPRFTEQDVIAFLSGYKNGEISNPSYSGKLIEAFADQVYLFEDYLVVRYSMDKAETRISLDEVSGLATSLVGGPSRIRTYDQAVMSRRLWTN